MTIYTRYFRVTSGPLMTRARELEAANSKARTAVIDFCKEIGADNALSYNDGRLAGFKFTQAPDYGVWKQPNSFGAHLPRKNTAAGRDLLKRIEHLPRIMHIMYALEAVGLYANSPVLLGNRCGYCPTLSGLPRTGVLFVGVPWREVSAEELAEYKRDREAKKTFSTEMDHLCWEPTAEMQEVKRWEVEKELDQLNAQLRAEQKEVGDGKQ